MWNAEPLRRKDRALPEEEARTLLQQGEWGVLASANAEGAPLATPLSYVVMDGGIYFHCAQSGQKLRNLAAQPRVCFCVVGHTAPVYDNNFTTYYESAVVHGAAAPVADEDEKKRALVALCQKYLPAHMDKAEGDIAASLPKTCVVRISIDSVTGKAKRPKT